MPQTAFDTHAEVGKLKRAGWPEEQAEAMVNLVTRAPLNPQLAQDMEWLKLCVQGIENRVLRMEDSMSGMATKVDLEVLRGESNTRIEALRSEMLRAFWIQGLALATLIIGLAGTMLSLAG